MENLIFKYLSNELSQQEWKELQNWLDESPQNRAAFNKLLSYHSNAANEVADMKEVIWRELQGRTGETGQNESILQPRRSYLYYFMRVAAILFVVATLSVVAYKTFESSREVPAITMVETVAEEGHKVFVKLPDGSAIYLNGGSKIIYPERFDRKIREVSLSGEAFFEVQHNPKKPFVVKFNGNSVKVLGTSFNINAYEGDDAASVAVATGKISYKVSALESEVILEADEMATYNMKTHELKQQKVDRLEVFGWKDKILYFKNESLDQIVTKLERWYGVQFEFKGDFSGEGTFTGEFRDKPLSEVLTGLAYLYGFDFEIADNTVTLK